MPTSFYDVVVIGDELAGAVAAAHLARRGFRSLILCSSPVEKETLGEFTLPRTPLVLTGLESPALKRLSNELHLLQLLRRRVEALAPGYQVLMPDHRIDVGEAELPRELARELGPAKAACERWLAEARELSTRLESLVVEDVTLPPDGFWDRRDLKRIAAQLPSEDSEPPLPREASMLSALPTRFCTDLADPGFVARARLGDLHRRGTWRLDGGREALRTLILDRIKTYSGEVRFNQTVHHVEVRRGKAVGVVVGPRQELVGCGHVIAALPAPDAVALLAQAPPRRLAEAAAQPIRHHRYLLHLVAPVEAFPDAIGRLAYSVRDPERPLEDDNALALHLTPSGPRHLVLTVEALATDPSPAGLLALRAGIRRHLESVVPFLDRHLRAVWSPHDGLPPELAGGPAAQPGSPTGTVPMRRRMEGQIALDGPRPIGVCGLPHATGIRRMLLASRHVMPGLGLEGELVAGWGAARLIAARDRRRVLDKGALLGG